MTRTAQFKRIFFVLIILLLLTASLNSPQRILADAPSCIKAFQKCLRDAQILDDLGKTTEMVELVVFCTYGYIWCLTFVE